MLVNSNRTPSLPIRPRVSSESVQRAHPPGYQRLFEGSSGLASLFSSSNAWSNRSRLITRYKALLRRIIPGLYFVLPLTLPFTHPSSVRSDRDRFRFFKLPLSICLRLSTEKLHFITLLFVDLWFKMKFSTYLSLMTMGATAAVAVPLFRDNVVAERREIVPAVRPIYHPIGLILTLAPSLSAGRKKPLPLLQKIQQFVDLFHF